MTTFTAARIRGLMRLPAHPPACGTNPRICGRDCGLMTWFRVDDSWWRHKKVRKLGRQRVLAAGVWSLCGDWSSDNLTDGFVPWEVVESWDPRRKSARRLIDVGLWEEDSQGGEHGIRFHDWADWNPLRDQVIHRRKIDAERRARWRERRRELHQEATGNEAESRQGSRRDTPGDGTRDGMRESQPESRKGSVLPDPTRPDPSSSLVALDEKGGGRTERVDARANPPPRCDQHRNLDPADPGPPCLRCRDARLAAEAKGRARRTAARDACHRCDEAGWVLGADGLPVEPARKCDHRKPT